MRHPDVDKFQFIQQRNTMKIRVDWHWLQRGGKWLDRFDLSDLVESSNLFLLYRGVYDSVFDTKPGMRTKRTFQGEKVDKRFDDLDDFDRGALDAFKFENTLREAYVDVKFRGGFSLRAGRQQIIWGESDGFRLLDRANALDLSWHFQQELPPPSYNLDDLRIPFWMIKGLYDFGSVGSWSNVFAEAYWNPGDWQPNKVSFLPAPWGVRIGQPLSNPRNGAFFFGRNRTERLMNGTGLFRQGNYDRNPIDNSQFGIRFNGVVGADTPLLPEGLQLQVGYLYQRFTPSGGASTSAAVVRGIPPTPAGNIQTQNLYNRETLPVEFYTPYIHTIGVAANYFDEWSKMVWRFEEAYDFGLPFYSCGHSPHAIAKQPSCVRETTFSPFLPGIRNHDVWSSLVAFDRPTWITPPQQEDDLLHHRPALHDLHDPEGQEHDRRPRPPERHARLQPRAAALLPRRHPALGDADDARGPRLLQGRERGAVDDLPARSGEQLQPGVRLGRRLVRHAEPRRESGATLSHQSEEGAELRAVGPRGLERRPLGDRPQAHLSVLTRRGWRRAGGRDPEERTDRVLHLLVLALAEVRQHDGRRRHRRSPTRGR